MSVSPGYIKRRVRKREREQRNLLNLKSELTRFWKHCKHDGSLHERLVRLKKFAEITMGQIKGRKTLRKEFNSLQRRCKRGRFCFTCTNLATIRHHIIQLQNGGNNSKLNIVSLCDECHVEIHPWLKTQPCEQVTNKSAVSQCRELTTPVTRIIEKVMSTNPLFSETIPQGFHLPYYEGRKDSY